MNQNIIIAIMTLINFATILFNISTIKKIQLEEDYVMCEILELNKKTRNMKVLQNSITSKKYIKK